VLIAADRDYFAVRRERDCSEVRVGFAVNERVGVQHAEIDFAADRDIFDFYRVDCSRQRD
jgi:hypothetical protein